MNGFGNRSGLRTETQIKKQKWEVMGCMNQDKEEDECRRWGKQSADGFAKKRAKKGGYGVKG